MNRFLVLNQNQHTFHDPGGPKDAHIKHYELITIIAMLFQLILTLNCFHTTDTMYTCSHHLTCLGLCVSKEHSRPICVSIVQHSILYDLKLCQMSIKTRLKFIRERGAF